MLILENRWFVDYSELRESTFKSVLAIHRRENNSQIGFASINTSYDKNETETNSLREDTSLGGESGAGTSFFCSKKQLFV